MAKNSVYRCSLKYVFLILIAVFMTTILHELAHWAMGEILGNKMTATLNGTNSVNGGLQNEWNRNYITMAGPLFTIIQAVMFYFLLKKYRRIELYPFLFFPLVMRFAAGLANFLGPNDEGRFGISIGVGLFTVPIVVCGVLFLLVRSATKEFKISWKFNMLNFTFCCLFLLFLTYIDAKFKIKII